MICREIDLKPGQNVTLHSLQNSYFLPKGLVEGSTAIFRSVHYRTAIVEQDGKEWEISDRCIEHEWEYQVRPNCWLPKDHPLTIKAFEEERIFNLNNKR